MIRTLSMREESRRIRERIQVAMTAAITQQAAKEANLVQITQSFGMARWTDASAALTLLDELIASAPHRKPVLVNTGKKRRVQIWALPHSRL